MGVGSKLNEQGYGPNSVAGAIVSSFQHTNRLIHESSPYLNQHAHNPVDWYPWGDEALGVARDRDLPIFLSIGYSACHWCHVMERETFGDEDVARYMNAHFVNIKVDREERPDLDKIYMTAVQILRGVAGWPMSVWLTPELKPFYGGTYFPPTDRRGLPGFRKVLETLTDLYANDRVRLVARANKIGRQISAKVALQKPNGDIASGLVDQAISQLKQTYDLSYGGFGGAPKFPPHQYLSLLLQQCARTGDEETLEMVTHTLDQMACGGVHDQLGGGFHRYATDLRWLVPNFEKMLYDNALLSRLYLDAYLVTGAESQRWVAERGLDYLLREMASPEGGFYASQDAESEGEEGRYYIWSRDEIRRILGSRDAAVFSEFYGVEETGNFDRSSSILHKALDLKEVAMRARLTCSELGELLAAGRAKLFEVRSRRIPPERDEKIITAWNGLAIGALARGGRAFDEPRYVNGALAAAEFIYTHMRRGRRLRRSYRNGKARFNAFLPDYSYLGLGLVDLYEATFDERWLEWANELAAVIIEYFRDPRTGSLYYTSHDHERLITRVRERRDGTVPSGVAMSILLFLRLARLTGDETLTERAEEVMRSLRVDVEKKPLSFPALLSAIEFHESRSMKIAVVGGATDGDSMLLRQLVNGRYLPNAVIAGRANGASSESVSIPFLDGKSMVDGKTTVYICENLACDAPVTDPVELSEFFEKQS